MTIAGRPSRGLTHLIALVLIAAAPLRAQGTISIEVPAGTLPAAPLVVVRSSGFVTDVPLRFIRLRLSLNSTFQLIVYDSVKAGDVVGFSMLRLLPESREIFAEATVLDGTGKVLGTTSRSLGTTGPRLELLSPDGRTSVNVESQQPTFIWRSAGVTSPPGPWIYDLLVTNVATGETDLRGGLTDTVLVYPDTLQFNTSYRWKVIARLARGFASDSAVASSPSSFVIFPPGAAVTTLLYQNFPNPFPAPSSSTTCIWFDLRVASKVELRVLDLRGHRVRILVPGQLRGDLPAGRYGRLHEGGQNGCDPRLEWDGTSADGTAAPPGVYLLQLVVDGALITTRKMLFLGR